MRFHLLPLLIVLVAFTLPSASVVADVTLPGSHDPSSPACGSRAWVAARNAVQAWCEGQAPMKRRYYEWSQARTRQKACADFAAGFRSCKATLFLGADQPGDPVMRVDDSDPNAELTYWEAHLERQGRRFHVVLVDFDEDCTGP